MRKIVILQGLPASGKTTWAKEKCRESGNQYKRVNKDDLRDMIDDGKWSKTNEKYILNARDNLIMQALHDGYDVIVDDTNLHEKHIEQIKSIGVAMMNNGIQVQTMVKKFEIGVDEAIERDLRRERSVGKDVIIRMYNQFVKPKTKKYEPNTNLPKAILVDMDGTLAKMQGRSPFEWDKVGEDKVNEPVANMVRKYNDDGYKIVILTGRDGSALSKTMGWLTANNIKYDKVFIRPEGNTEKDAIIKKRIFENHIEKKYNVEFVLDDRNQVVQMWRELGLTCLQVADGNF